MRSIGGADGCRSGWFLAAKDLGSEKIFCEKCPSTCDLFEKSASLEALALDISIGSTDKDLRQYDLQVRRLHRAGRASSVFKVSADAIAVILRIRWQVDFRLPFDFLSPLKMPSKFSAKPDTQVAERIFRNLRNNFSRNYHLAPIDLATAR